MTDNENKEHNFHKYFSSVYNTTLVCDIINTYDNTNYATSTASVVGRHDGTTKHVITVIFVLVTIMKIIMCLTNKIASLIMSYIANF